MNISCIIPAYNPENISRLLESINQSDLRPIEIIIVDDNSESRISTNNNNTKVIHNTRNLGPSESRNIGAHHSNGDILLFLDSDIIIPKTLFSDVHTFFQENKEFDLWSGSFSSYSHSNNIATKYKSAYMRAIHDNSPIDANFVLGACVAVKRKDFISWPSEMRFAEDSFWAHQYVFHYGKKIYFDKNNKVDHYKIYDIKSWIKNDFFIASGMVRSFLSFFNSRKDRSFSHVSNNQLISVLLAPIIFLTIIFELYILAIILVIVWFVISLPLILKIAKYSGIELIVVLFMSFLNNLAHFSGIVYGTLKYIVAK